MSGGSMDYLYMRVNDVAEELINSKCRHRQIFGEHLVKVAKALFEIELVDSGDSSPPDDINAIQDVFGEAYNSMKIKKLNNEAKQIISELSDLLNVDKPQ